MRTPSLTLLLVGLLSPAAALAGRGSEVAVVGLHVQGLSDRDAVRVSDEVCDALDRTERLVALPPGEVQARVAGRESLILEAAFLSRGRTLFEEGRILYGRADFEAAVPVLMSAVVALEAGLVGTAAPRDLIDALLLLGQAHASLGDTEAADAAFARVVVLDPARELDSVNYPPKTVRQYEQVRDTVLGRAKARLSVQAPHDAVIYVDGVESLSPTLSLPPGVHYVLVVGADGRRDFTRLDLAEDTRETWKAQLTERVLARPADSEDARAEQIGLLYRALGEHVGTGLVLLGGEVSDRTVAVQLYEPRTGNFSKVVTAGAGEDPVGAVIDLMPTLANYVTDQGTLRADRVSPVTAPLYISDNSLLASMLLDPKPIVETVTVTRGPPWYLWAGVGVVAAGGAAGVVYAVTSSAGPSDEEGTDKGVITVGPFP